MSAVLTQRARSRVAARLRLACLGAALCAVLCAPRPAAADEPYALGLGLHAGWSVSTQKWTPIDDGALLGASLSLESTYFLTPVFSVHHAWLASSDTRADLGAPLGDVAVESSLRSLAFLLGPAVDLGPVRVTGSVGLYRLTVESTVDGVTLDASTLAFGYALSVEGWVYRWRWGRLGAFGMVNFLAEAQLAYFGGGLTMRLDAALSE